MKILTFSSVLLIGLVIGSCKKTADTLDPEELPQFGNCTPVQPSGDMLSAAIKGPFVFGTAGGDSILIDLKKAIILKLRDYPGFSLELWGTTEPGKPISGNHENLNGKHVKTRPGTVRTIIFPDGVKITMTTQDKIGPLVSITIYDGGQSHHINADCGVLEYSATDAAITHGLDANEADGETAKLELTNTGLLYVNIYTEDTPGKKTENRVKIGEIYRNEPNRVDDYYN